MVKHVLLTYRDNNRYPKDYVEALNNAGVEVTLRCFHNENLPFDESDYDGLLLSGGIDIDPALYGCERHEKSEVEEGYDAFELDILKAFMEREKPVLGICRGAQILAVAMSGTLYQHLPDLPWVTCDHSNCGHGVNISPGSRLYRLFGSTLDVNSRHHQAAQNLPGHLKISAYSTDGVIECFEYRNIMAVQWHPENLRDVMMPIFHDFAAGFPE